MIPPPPTLTLFPYTTLFRSQAHLDDDEPRHRSGGRLAGHRRRPSAASAAGRLRSEEHTSELQSRGHVVCRLLLEKKKRNQRLGLRHDEHEERAHRVRVYEWR